MKVKVDIVLGFLSSGKTTFINSVLECGQLQNETIVIIQCESGKINIGCSLEYNEIIVLKKENNTPFDVEFIKDVIEKYSPDRIFIEYNGMSKNYEFIQLFNDLDLRKVCKIHKIICTADAKKLNMYLINMGDIIKEQIFNSDIIILNNTRDINKKEVSNLRKIIKHINEITKVFECACADSQKLDLIDRNICIEKKNSFFTLSNILFLCLILFAVNYFGIRIFLSANIDFTKINLSGVQRFNTIFISILIQGFPFILIGTFVSSIIQICISKDTIIKFFPKNIFLSCIAAAFAGFLFPVCDCGSIPLARGFIKKGIPISAVITFILCAPIVNPIVIISTIYAFPNMHYVVIYRVCAGIIISIIVGLIMHSYSAKDIATFTDDIIDCQCGFCTGEFVSDKNILNKIKAIFIHAGDEFFKVGKFMIIGSFLSSILQTLVSQKNIGYFSNDRVSSLLIMMLFAFVLSVCSTSDAFIARGFLTQFSISSIMGFLVLGPMIDIKNTMMLFGSFKKEFVLKLIFIIFIVSFTVLINFNL